MKRSKPDAARQAPTDHVWAELLRTILVPRQDAEQGADLLLSPAPLSPDSDRDFLETLAGDAKWFKANPGRRHRLRPATPEEVKARKAMGLNLPFGAVEMAVVGREADGTLTVFCTLVPAGQPVPQDSESRARKIFESILEGRPFSSWGPLR